MEVIKSKSTIQKISLVVGFILFLIGLIGFVNPNFLDLHLTTFHSFIVAISGAALFYNGYTDNERNCFIACLSFGLFFLLNALAGFAFGQSESTGSNPELIRLIPNFYELGTRDHVLNGIIGVVLLGGALDWWKIHHERRRWNRHDRKRERLTRLAHH